MVHSRYSFFKPECETRTGAPPSLSNDAECMMVQTRELLGITPQREPVLNQVAVTDADVEHMTASSGPSAETVTTSGPGRYS